LPLLRLILQEFSLLQNTDLGIVRNEPCQTQEAGFETCLIYVKIGYKGTVPYRNYVHTGVA
jgi:hypothetical protein